MLAGNVVAGGSNSQRGVGIQELPIVLYVCFSGRYVISGGRGVGIRTSPLLCTLSSFYNASKDPRRYKSSVFLGKGVYYPHYPLCTVSD